MTAPETGTAPGAVTPPAPPPPAPPPKVEVRRYRLGGLWWAGAVLALVGLGLMAAGVARERKV